MSGKDQLATLIGERRLQKVAVIIKPATVLAFHKALVKRKYSKLYSNRAKRDPGRKPPDQALIDLVVEMKRHNPSFGYGRISMQILEAFGVSISRFAVGRILRKNKHNLPFGDGPSWLTAIGHISPVDPTFYRLRRKLIAFIPTTSYFLTNFLQKKAYLILF